MRCLVVVALSSTALAGPALESAQHQHSWIAFSTPFAFVQPISPVSNLTGSIDIDAAETQVTYNSLSWTNDATTVTQTVNGVEIELSYDAANMTVPNFTTPIVSSNATQITTAGLDSATITVPNLTGSWKLTGSLGTVVQGTFDFDLNIQSLPLAETITVTRDTNGDISDYEWADGMNLIVPHIPVLDRTVFDSTIDGVDIELVYNGGNVQLSSMDNLGPTASTVPEPSAFLFLALASLYGSWRNRLKGNQ